MAISKSVMEGRKARVVNSLQKETFNLDLLDLKTLANNLQQSIKSRRPSSCFFIFSGKRQLEKKELDLRQAELVLQEVNTLIEIAQDTARLKAELFLIPETIDGIINGRRNEIELQRQRFLDSLDEIRDNSILRKITLRQANAEAEKIETDNYIARLIGEAKASHIRAGARAEEARAGMLEKLKEEMDMNNISASQAFVLAKGLNPNDQSDVDFAMKEKMFSEDLKKAKEQNRILKSDADLREHSVKNTIGEDAEAIGGFGED